ncbi:MAG: Gfo/Idh/MocA family oxidoreductase [Phycisphaerae bacterium]|nr:Gfo/Idh/MocA family oxidoreductase [Phycisphaerae bacterium]
MVLTSKQRQIGKDNYADALKVTRRQFLAGAAAVPSAAAMYWGYDKLKGDPVKVAVIGTGDQGKAHIRSMNPDYLDMVAFSDIRPSNQKNTLTATEEKFGKPVKLFENYEELLAQPEIEMVIIALPLHLHAPATIKALAAGKHVLCEKLMAKTVMDCKEMVRAADQYKKLLAIGHQRHYSYLYANCLAIVEEPDIMGDVKHIRAYWHRNQTAGGAADAKSGKYDSWHRAIPDEDRNCNWKAAGYESLEQLVRWRLDLETGGGLMVELGSHQLDAASIFLGKVHPLTVQGVGVTSFFEDNRAIEDHVFLTYEFPEDVVVSYSSICTNAFDGYGEQVMGTKATMIVQQELDAFLFREGVDKDTRITWAENRTTRPTADSGSSTQWVTGAGTPETMTSRGYREEQEHMAYLIRNPQLWEGLPDDKAQLPRCHGRVALGDAVITLASNLAMRKKTRIEFKKEWFQVESNSNPEDEV